MPNDKNEAMIMLVFFVFGLLCLILGNKVTEWLINESIRKEAFRAAKDEYYKFFEERFTAKGEEAVSAYNWQALKELERVKEENERLRAVLSEKGWDCDCNIDDPAK